MTHCSMPDHGKPAATSACCRPDSPSYMGANPMKELPWRGEALLATPVLSIRTADFWADAPTWRRAASNTFTCLVGCMVGDFGMMFYLGAFHPGVSLPVMMVLAMTSGLVTSFGLETVMLRLKEGFGWQRAVKTAFSMSLISMLSMEFAATATDYALTGGAVDVSAWWFWAALAVSLVVGFLTPLPYNYYMLREHGRVCH